MVFWNGNSIGNGQAGAQSGGNSSGIVPIDTTIKSKIPRPLPPEAPVTPPNLNMPGAGLPNLNIPAPRLPSLLTAPDPNDPKYKMGIGGRIMGTVANFLSGMNHQGPVVNTGKGALNSQYYRDEENRLRQLNAQAPNQIPRSQQQGYWEQWGRGRPQVQSSANGSSSKDSEDEKPLFGVRTDQ
jgi:hypothetical protein